jgi:hypothetical protein
LNEESAEKREKEQETEQLLFLLGGQLCLFLHSTVDIHLHWSYHKRQKERKGEREEREC